MASSRPTVSPSPTAPAGSRRRLVLASTSPYRRELLARLQIPFEVASPGIEEAALPDEPPLQTARRLALAKAQAVARTHADALIIGSDQVAHCDGRRFGKPGSLGRAREQLRELSGRTVHFETALCLLDAASGRAQSREVTTQVRFRKLAEAEISRYLAREDVLGCAGSARSEGLGIALLEAVIGDDPNALIGLPLIALCSMLRHEGMALP